MKEYLDTPLEDWASAIALRISDEWIGNIGDNHEDVKLLKNVLESCLCNYPQECIKLIGTTIIEESYFESLD